MLRVRSVACVLLFALPACVVRLSDRNAPEPNGAVTGPPADCSAGPKEKGAFLGTEAQFKFVGRFRDTTPDEPTQGKFFDWSGSYIQVRFNETTKVIVKIGLTGDEPQDQIFVFQLDNQPPQKVQLTVLPGTSTPLTEYPVAVPDTGVHELTIYKNTEAQKGAVLFQTIDLQGGKILPPTQRERRIEFIGDSIMCGYGNEGKNATCPFEVKVRDVTDNNGNPVIDPATGKPKAVTVPLTENQYLAFTALAARELDADAYTYCWSGKGVYLNYKEGKKFESPGVFKDDPDGKVTVPQLWEKRYVASDPSDAPTIRVPDPVDPLDISKQKEIPNPNFWDFAKETPEQKPQVVVISLGTNDYSRDTKEDPTGPGKLQGDNIPDQTLLNPVEMENFRQTYLQFVRTVRKHRPDAHIFIATPPMLSDQYPWDNARKSLQDTLKWIASEMEKEGGKVYAMNLVEQGFRYGLGCDYHPNLDVHRIMAKQLVGAIKSKTCWSR